MSERRTFWWKLNISVLVGKTDILGAQNGYFQAKFAWNLLQNSELVAFKFVKSFKMTQDESQNH